jgi:hypothetical protein
LIHLHSDHEQQQPFYRTHPSVSLAKFSLLSNTFEDRLDRVFLDDAAEELLSACMALAFHSDGLFSFDPCIIQDAEEGMNELMQESIKDTTEEHATCD